MDPRPRRASARGLAALTVGAALAVSLAAPGAGASTVNPTHSTLVVTMHGNGHGHGLSQYGAQGAALAGLRPAQIIGFYYPGTVVRRLAQYRIQVRLSGAGSTVQVAPSSRMWVHGRPGYLPTTGVRRYRLIADTHGGVALQSLSTAARATWRTMSANLPSGTWFHRHADWPIRLFRTDGTSIAYRGTLHAHRLASGGLMTVNGVSLDMYTAGVVPREMPISWRPAAVEAQALAARSYGRYAITHPRGTRYDICDTTMCQVYGGAAKYSTTGRKLWSDAMWAAQATSNRTITYHGKTIFAQFSASNGGWTADGGKPYLIARHDPYDNARSGDPYLSYRRTVATSTVARYYGLAKVTRIEITGRVAGGRITTAYVSGVTPGKHATRIRTDGSNLSWAVGAGTTWLSFANP